MGLTAPGEGERAIHEGWVERDGKLPVNVSGGLKAKGHTVNNGAQSSGVSTIMRVNRNGQTKLEGGVDPRREGIVLGDGAL